jgi:uncharacterized membrane protein HdeD (DUF308 family)
MDCTLGTQLWKGTLGLGVLTIVLGAMVLAWPGPTILVASTIFGVYLLISGLAELFFAFTLPRSAATRVMLFLTGALSLVLAILSFRHIGDAYAVLLLSLWIGTGFIFLGVSETAVSVSERDLPGRGWYVVLGLMSVIAGGVVLVWPFDSIVVLTIVAGVSLVVLGLIRVVQAFQIRSDTKAVLETREALSQRVAA